MTEPVIYVIELGGSHCTAGAFVDGELMSFVDVPTPQSKSGGEVALRETMKQMVDTVASTAPPMQAVSVSFSSFLDLREKKAARNYGPLPDSEVMISAAHINGILNLPFFEWLEGAGWGVPLHVENDVNTALRAAVDLPTAVSVNLGTGVAAGVKRSNRIVHMPNTWSCYQIGHGFRWVMPDDMIRKCGCGSVGCLEAAVGAWALTDRYGVRPESAPADVYAQMCADIVKMLSPAIADLVDKSGIEDVVLTGRAAEGFDEALGLADQLQTEVRAVSPHRDVSIRLIEQASTAGLVGAGLAALDNQIVARTSS